MCILILKLHLKRIFFMKNLYKKRDENTSVNSGVLSVGLLVVNLHSILTLIEVYLNVNLGLINFWIPTDIPKSSFGYILGFVFSILYILFISQIRRHIPQSQQYMIMRQVVSLGNLKTYSVTYVFLTIILFFFSIYKIAVTVIY